MKKLIYLIVLLLVVVGCSKNEMKPAKEKLLFDNSYYKDLVIENVKMMNILYYTEAGLERTEITSKDEIISYYNEWKNTKLLEEVSTSCEDNTLIYEFIMNSGESIIIEKECDWLVINNKRYSFEK